MFHARISIFYVYVCCIVTDGKKNHLSASTTVLDLDYVMSKSVNSYPFHIKFSTCGVLLIRNENYFDEYVNDKTYTSSHVMLM